MKYRCKCGCETPVREVKVRENEYLEVELRCLICSHVWCEIYEQGQLVKSIDLTPEPRESRPAVCVVNECPICKEYCDSKSGIPYNLETDFERNRLYAHRSCLKQVGESTDNAVERSKNRKKRFK